MLFNHVVEFVKVTGIYGGEGKVKIKKTRMTTSTYTLHFTPHITVFGRSHRHTSPHIAPHHTTSPYIAIVILHTRSEQGGGEQLLFSDVRQCKALYGDVSGQYRAKNH